ncbi:MEDS domain-containing protein [Bacillus sp. F19]|nr:MEDS domain-containing protein [Bacillus sp. F19]
MSSLELISVCAYDADRVPDSLKESLLRSHGYLMTDEEFKKQTIEQDK